MLILDGRVGAWRVWSEWVADAAHPEPAEHLLGYRSGGEGSEPNLGDLGPRDPPTGRSSNTASGYSIGIQACSPMPAIASFARAL